MPVKTEGGRVVFQRAVGRLKDRLDEVLYGFPRMHLRATREQHFDVDVAVALEDAIGEEHQAVARLQRQMLHPVLMSAHSSERRIYFERDAVDPSVAHPQGQGMAGIDDLRRPGAYVDARELACHEAAPAHIVREPSAR